MFDNKITTIIFIDFHTWSNMGSNTNLKQMHTTEKQGIRPVCSSIRIVCVLSGNQDKKDSN
jgi:hypothetical protein